MIVRDIELPHFMQRPSLLSKLDDLFSSHKLELRLVGGSLRDLLLGLPVYDYDLAINSDPKRVCEILNGANIGYIETGISHGTITVKSKGSEKAIELTSLRSDVETYGRHAKVEFGTSFREDAKRRDFTINSLSLDFDGKLYDYTTGLADLEKKLLRFVGEAKVRISEDYLRILRFFRFLSKLDLSYNQGDLAACFEGKEGLSKLSIERVSKELSLILISKNFASVMDLIIKGELDRQIFGYSLLSKNPELLADFKSSSNYFSLNKEPISLAINLALLQIASEEIFKKLRLSQNLRKKIALLYDNLHKETLKSLIVKKIGIEDIKIFLQIKYIKSIISKGELEKSQLILKKYEKVKFPLTGGVLSGFNFKNKKQIGTTISWAREIWYDSNFENQKDQLIKRIAEMMKEAKKVND